MKPIEKEKIIELMQSFGARYILSKDSIRFTSICHGGDGYNLAYYPDKGTFYCFSNCGFLTIYDVVSKVKHITIDDAKKFVNDKFGLGKTNKGFYIINTLYDDVYDLINLHRKESADRVYYDDVILNYFEDIYYEGWLKEGISPAVMKRFEIKWYEYRKHIIIPVRDIDGRLLGIRRRSLVDGEAKYKPLDCEGKSWAFPTGECLYGLYQNQNIISDRKKCYLFEGEKSVLKAATIYGDFPCVACFSHSVSRQQINLLIDLGVEEVILCFDYDGVGERKIYRLLAEKIKTYGIRCKYLYYGYKTSLDAHESPIDKGKKVFEELLQQNL